jgi:hypothetical protein
MYRLIVLMLATGFLAASCQKEQISGNAMNLIGTWDVEYYKYEIADNKKINEETYSFILELNADGSGDVKTIFTPKKVNWYYGTEPTESVALKFTTTNQFGGTAVYAELYDVIKNTPDKHIWERDYFFIDLDTKTRREVIRLTLNIKLKIFRGLPVILRLSKGLKVWLCGKKEKHGG